MFSRPSSLPSAPSVPVSGKALKTLFKTCRSMPEDLVRDYLKELSQKSTLTASRKIDRDLQLLLTTTSPSPTRPIILLSTFNKSSTAIPTVYSVMSQLLSSSPSSLTLPIAVTNSFVESKIKNGAKKLYKGGIHRFVVPSDPSTVEAVGSPDSSPDDIPDSSPQDSTQDSTQALPPSLTPGSACLVVSRGMLVATGVIDENMEVVIWSTFDDVLWKAYCEDLETDCVVMEDWEEEVSSGLLVEIAILRKIDIRLWNFAMPQYSNSSLCSSLCSLQDECEEEEEEEEDTNMEGENPDEVDPNLPPPPPSVEESGPDPTQLLYDTMLNIAAYSSNATLKLPMLTSTLYSSHVLPLLVERSGAFQIKDTAWKKFGVFLAETNFVTLKEKSPGVIEVTKVDRSHPDIRSHKRENPSILPAALEASGGSQADSNQTIVRKVELYVFPKEVRSCEYVLASLSRSLQRSSNTSLRSSHTLTSSQLKEVAQIKPEEITATASTVERRGTEYLTKSEVTAFLKPVVEASATNGVVTVTPALAIYGLDLNSTIKQKPLVDAILKKVRLQRSVLTHWLPY